MHNAAFHALGYNGVYVAFEVTDPAAALAGLKALGVRGVSVTIPHKEAILAHLDEVDPVAAKIGAVNTVAIDNQRAIGSNTDWLGANRALAEVMDLAGSTILVLGAGGAARAIGFGLLEAGAKPMIASRTPARGQALAATLGCPWQPLAEVAHIPADALINATSVGMQSNETPVAGPLLDRFRVVMDIVYAPLETRLLREAAAAGCQTVDGLAMLLYQGAAQLELWTGRPAPVAVMREALVKALSDNGS